MVSLNKINLFACAGKCIVIHVTVDDGIGVVTVTAGEEGFAFILRVKHLSEDNGAGVKLFKHIYASCT